ncbi:MAG: DUF4956 domain-containing protein [Deltaproteobacteria bacterium]|nr:DUF4956 domain-containing protein [Deltaproteobacteria bacterium]
MDEIMQSVTDIIVWRQAFLSVLLGYVLSQAVAAVYAWTYRGLSYSRAMVQALVVAGVVSAMLMLAIGNSLARGIGIVGTLALIRFRTNLRDPMDMIFVLASFAAGIAAGTGSYATAVIGTAVFLVVVTLVRLSGFGAHQQFDGVLRLQLPIDPELEASLQQVLRKCCRRFALIMLRDAAQGREQERAYQITLRDPEAESSLISAVSAIKGASAVTVAMQEATVEL